MGVAVISTATPFLFMLKSQKLATRVPIDDNEDLVIDRFALNCYEYD
jgi:hypothetical protein